MKTKSWMRGIHRTWLGIFALAGWAVLSAVAQEAAALRVGLSPVFPPMVFKQGKELAGVEVDLARELGKSLGRQVTFLELPWEDQVDALSGGRIDIIMSSMSITTARRHVVDFAKPYLTISQMTLVRAEDQVKYYFGFPIRPSGTIGVLKATTGEFLCLREFSKTSLKTFKSTPDAVQALKKKKIDLFISDSTLIWHLAGKHATDNLVAVQIPLSEEQLAWAIRKGDEKLLKAADEFIAKSSKDGSMEKTLRRWTAIGP